MWPLLLKPANQILNPFLIFPCVLHAPPILFFFILSSQLFHRRINAQLLNTVRLHLRLIPCYQTSTIDEFLWIFCFFRFRYKYNLAKKHYFQSVVTPVWSTPLVSIPGIPECVKLWRIDQEIIVKSVTKSQDKELPPPKKNCANKSYHV